MVDLLNSKILYITLFLINQGQLTVENSEHGFASDNIGTMVRSEPPPSTGTETHSGSNPNILPTNVLVRITCNVVTPKILLGLYVPFAFITSLTTGTIAFIGSVTIANIA